MIRQKTVSAVRDFLRGRGENEIASRLADRRFVDDTSLSRFVNSFPHKLKAEDWIQFVRTVNKNQEADNFTFNAYH